MSKPDDYRMTATFTIVYTGEFAENIPYVEAEKIVASWLAQDILDGRLAVSKFDREVDVEYDYQAD